MSLLRQGVIKLYKLLLCTLLFDFGYFFSERVVDKTPTEAKYAVVVGGSMFVFVICEILLILLLDIDWIVRKRSKKQ